MGEPDLYAVLGLSRTAEEKEARTRARQGAVPFLPRIAAAVVPAPAPFGGNPQPGGGGGRPRPRRSGAPTAT